MPDAPEVSLQGSEKGGSDEELLFADDCLVYAPPEVIAGQRAPGPVEGHGSVIDFQEAEVPEIAQEQGSAWLEGS